MARSGKLQPNRLRALWRSRRGAVAIEFALVLTPIVLAFTFGALQLAYIAFAQSAMEAAIRDASRAGITGAAPRGMTRQEALEDLIEQRMSGFKKTPCCTIQITTRVYSDFTEVGKPEPWAEVGTPNGVCNAGETFQDINGNGRWDLDMARAGQGGPLDVVAYTARYPLQIWLGDFIPGMGNRFFVSATTVIRNEPYGEKVNPAVSNGVC
jgi:hypothetical protein